MGIALPTSTRTRPLAAILVVAAVAGCTGPITVKPASPEKVTEKPVEELRGIDSLSLQTQQLLRLYGLEDRLPRHPTAVVAVLRGLQGSRLEHLALAAQAEVSLLTALNVSESVPTDATGWYLLAAARAYEFMFGGNQTAMERAMDPRFQRSRRVYNRAVSGYLDLLEQTAGGFRTHEQATRFEFFHVDIEAGTDRLSPKDADALFVARELKIRGLRNRYRREGIGAPLVAYRENRRADPLDRFYLPEGIVNPVTAVLEFGDPVPETVGHARSVRLSFYDPRETDTIQIGSMEVPLQADFTTHYAYQASLSALPGLARKALLRPEDYVDRMGLFLMEPYDPQKIPVIMVHGLRSSPLAWMELTNDLFGDPDLRSRYQIWHFMYPTGLPYLYIGMVFRSKLESLRVELDPEQDDPAMQSMVIIAHSMGGLVTRSLVCDSGMRIWNSVFRVPPEKLRGTPQDTEWVKDMFIFSSQPFISRVVFIATPHRGADAAGSFLGQIGSSLVELPEYFTERIERVRDDNREFATEEVRSVIDKGAPNSIRSLRPQHPVLQALGGLPIDPSIPYHTIIGDRGRGPDEPISDGWVDYESAHLEGAESEAIVPSGHAAYAHPSSIAEIQRILRVHLREAS